MSAQPPGAQFAHVPLSADDPREIGGYRLRARLGAGGMGIVYLAHTPGGRPIALKAVRGEFAADPEFRRRFADEVASARRIHGLFTAQVVDSGVDAPTPWLATAYVPGPSLQQVVERHGPLPARTVLLLVAGVAEALQAIHAAGVVHRDLKPANVLIAEDGPRVIDFGIARAADAGGLTGAGLRIGTAAYMAPEQAQGFVVTPATDVFALGSLAAYVAGGVLPFGGGPESGALYRVVHEEPDLSCVPSDLYDLLRCCLAKRPEDRPVPGELIDAVRAHPAVGGRPEFTDGWLPRGVSSEIAAHGEPLGRGGYGTGQHIRPEQVHVQPTRAAVPTPTAVANPASTGVARPASDFGDRVAPAPRRARRGRSRWPVAALTLALLLALGGGAYYFYDHGKGAERDASGGSHGPSPRPSSPAATSSSPSPSSSSAGPEYVQDYADAELTAPDPDYEFDLAAGKVVPAETVDWYLEVADGEFVLPEDSDAFVAAGYVLSPAECVRGIETEPVTDLPFDDLADERPFCVRSPDEKSIVIVNLIENLPDEGSVTVVMSRYRESG
ncbi:serine/threonine-protein kinase [Streptomyces xanthii]|uniref:Serine/threonine protein kinase n=1 Tax=Streptomyces xanthii TaxID=2768069 RepID=A0A7H1BI63_9ACTN|nr:serine/threonine-protein kinase [Streptomyces xanthii]QNS08418.1 serine/threonine protein kinase [Streptomyces xanthii]